ncbi:hypothetical protein M2103_002149 [Ereboglobus sp. PH5-5]|nr:hypothetical protein [Ereboglobus sp. PH5-5]
MIQLSVFASFFPVTWLSNIKEKSLQLRKSTFNTNENKINNNIISLH